MNLGKRADSNSLESKVALSAGRSETVQRLDRYVRRLPSQSLAQVSKLPTYLGIYLKTDAA